MPDPRCTTGRPAAAAAREADGQCRGIGPIRTPAGAQGGGGRGLRSGTSTDVIVARSVVRKADGQADGETVRVAIGPR